MYPKSILLRIAETRHQCNLHISASALICFLFFSTTTVAAAEQATVKQIGAIPVSMTGRVIAKTRSFDTNDTNEIYNASNNADQSYYCRNQPTLNTSTASELYVDDDRECVITEAGNTVIWMQNWFYKDIIQQLFCSSNIIFIANNQKATQRSLFD